MVDIHQAGLGGRPTVVGSAAQRPRRRGDGGAARPGQPRQSRGRRLPAPVSAEGDAPSAVSGSRLWAERGEPWRAVMVRRTPCTPSPPTLLPPRWPRP
ncbi:hypothetical protein QJS66_22190 [Kocuria rhizophila]|nr:hypothetical protein QJS66_22190 [Kocuria rhizophila]